MDNTRNKNNLKIAIDSGPLTSGDSVRGIGVYVRELTNSLQKLQNSKTENIKIELLTDHRSPFTVHYDIIHFTSFNPFNISVPFTKPQNTKFVLTIYDLIPLIYPIHYPPGVKGKIRFLINKYLIRRNVDAIITISETSKKDICRLLGVSPKKVFVTYLASREIFQKLDSKKWKSEITKKYQLPGKFALYVGDLNYNKNILNLVKACEIAKIPLVIVGKQAIEINNFGIDAYSLSGPMDHLRSLFGKPHPELAHYADLLKSFKENEKIIRLGFVKDDDLAKIYNLATVYVQPSYYEGFGLPILEAVACCAPVVATKTQCLVEILGDDFDYVDATDSESIANGILNPNINKRLQREYSWDKTAEETMKVYNS